MTKNRVFFFSMFHGRFRRKRACSLVLCRPVGLPDERNKHLGSGQQTSKVVEIWVTTSCFKPHCVIWMWFTYISIKSSDVGCIPNPFEVVKPSHQISFRTWHGRPGGCTTSMRSPCLQWICNSNDIQMLVNKCITVLSNHQVVSLVQWTIHLVLCEHCCPPKKPQVHQHFPHSTPNHDWQIDNLFSDTPIYWNHQLTIGLIGQLWA